MSSINHLKPHPSQPATDKENAPISSNLSFERRYSAAHKHRKVNDILLHPSLVQYGQESVNLHPSNLHHNLPTSKSYKEADILRKLTATKSKKIVAAERSSYNSRPGSVLLAQKDRYSLANRESRMSLVERGDRYSFDHPARTSLIETQAQRSQLIEPARASYAEKEPMKLNPTLEPVVRDDKHEEEIIPEKITSFAENDRKKGTAEVVSTREQCHKIMEEYAPVIMETLKMKDKEVTPAYCLKKHKIPSNLRAKMIDWMVEVLGSYKCNDQTFFVAVNTMDLYLQKTKAILEVSDLHLVGVTCMFMASKYEEIYPLRLTVVHEKIAHKKLNPAQIKQKEMEILTALEYKMTNVTPNEFIMNTIYQLNLKEIMTPKLYDYLQKVCTYIAKANMYDYELLSQQNYSELAASTLFVTFKIIEQLDKSFPLTQLLGKIKEILKVEEDIVYDCATRILSIAKNFDKLYPNLENLKKFHSFSFEEISPIKSNDEKARNTTH